MSVFLQSFHRHVSVQRSSLLRHWHRSVWQSVLQPHEINSIIESGAGGFVVITGSNISLVSSHFQPYSFGSGHSADRKCKDFHCNAVK